MSYSGLENKTTFNKDANRKAIEITIAKAAAHNKLDFIVHPLDKALRSALVKIVEDEVIPIVKGIEKRIESLEFSRANFFDPSIKSS